MLQLANGKQQFLDQNGAPLAGGQVYHYAPGTTNPITTYKDSAGQSANTNPIQLDSRGQAVIWGTGTFRQVVTDAAGTLIWDQTVNAPDVNAPASNLAIQLLSSLGASLIGLIQAGAGAVKRTIQAKLFETASVLDYGAVGDGDTDDLAAIQKALNAALHVTFPLGKSYLVTGPLVLRSNHELVFRGGAALLAGANNISLIKATTLTGVVLHAPAVSANGKTGCIGIDYTAMQTGCRIENPVFVGDLKGLWLRANCYGIQINRPVAYQCPHPIELGSSCNGNTILTPEFNNLPAIGGTGTGIGINLNDAEAGSNTIGGGGYIQGYTNGIIDKGNTNSIGNGSLYFENCTDSHIFLNGAVHAKVSNTFHFGDGSASCIKARNVHAANVLFPSMVPGNVSLGLFDVDASNSNFKAEINTSDGYNTPLGTVTGVMFQQEDGGQFTMSAAGATSFGACNYLYNKFAYKRVGNICHFTGALVCENHTGTGPLLLSGMPYLADDGYNLTMIAVNVSGPVINGAQVKGEFVNKTPQMEIKYVDAAGVLQTMNVAPGFTLHMSGFYFCQ